MVAASMFCVLAGSTAWAEQGPPPGELETLKRMMQEVISENQELTKRVRELEAEMTKLKGAMTKQEQATEEAAKEAAKEPKKLPRRPRRQRAGQPKKLPKEAAKEPAEEAAREVTREPTQLEELASMINEYVEFGGVIEVQGGWINDFNGVSESDIRLETAEVDFEVRVNEWATGTLIIEWDDDEDKLTVDEAFITLGDTERFPLFTQAGRLVVPFGISTGDPVADTLTIEDPLTIEVFETKEDIVLLGAEVDGFNAGIYAFNGDTNERGGEDHIEQFGGTVGYRMKNDNIAFDVDIDIISSVFDSDGLTEAFPDALESDYVPGLAAHVKFRTAGGFSIVTEFNGALSSAEFISDGEPVSIEPNAWQVQLGYETEVIGKDTIFALGYSQSHDLAGAFPERRLLATIGSWLLDGVLLEIEYVHEEDYDEADGGTGESGDAFTMQLTYEW